MSDFKFSCPHCGQHIEAGADYAGLEINCPACGGALVVSGAVHAPPPVPALLARSARSGVAEPAPAGSSCPSCSAPLARGAVVCTQCGYNLTTKKGPNKKRRKAHKKRAADQWETPWYKTPYPYVGVLVLVLGVLYLLGRENPAIMLLLVGIAVLYVLVTHLIVVVAAFREGVGTGFLTLCIPFFAIYFVFKVSDSDILKVLYGAAILINLILRFLPE